MSFIRPVVEVEALPRTGAREDFAISAIGPGNTDYRFHLSITYTALGMWQADGAEAAAELAGVVAEIHGTARTFPEEGFWFDSYNVGDTVRETSNLIRNKGWKAFIHPSARDSLGAELLGLLADLDRDSMHLRDAPFFKTLDVLFERSRAIEDLESNAVDHPNFIYRICILSAIIDRFDFDEGTGSLNGLVAWLEGLVDEDAASELTTTYRMVKRLRRQYPIHEEYEVDADGERKRRADVVEAEQYFDLKDDTSGDWRLVFERFRRDTNLLHNALAELTAGA
ncbi:MAG: hypothetical protein IH943_07180 [Acidobacteria bacterium]|nr:hypothetical protein [Acidobacteriota bacterium]